MPTIDLWLFAVTDPLTGKRRRTTYRLTIEAAGARYIDPEPIEWSREVRTAARGHGHAYRRDDAEVEQPLQSQAAIMTPGVRSEHVGFRYGIINGYEGAFPTKLNT
jgi:hypothetical protein